MRRNFEGWYIYLLRKELERDADVMLRVYVGSGWYIYVARQELDSRLNEERKQLIKLGVLFYIFGEIAILIIVLYSVYKGVKSG